VPTIPPEQALPAGDEPHRHRQIAESFGSDAERYDRVRPDYPAALVERILAASPGSDVLDVGCGTGIAARQFQAAGAHVLGVDVDERMAELARRAGVEVEVAAFEAWDPAGREFDAVIAGAAWHWVDPVAGAAKAAHVLRPGGLLAAFWNLPEPPAAVAEAFAAVFRRVVPDLPFTPWAKPATDAGSPLLTKVLDGLREAGAFGEPEQWSFTWERSYTRDEWLEVVPTQGGLGRLPKSTLDELLAGLGDAIDAVGGTVTMSYTTFVVAATRTVAT
jgi:SAM-dependent methyltransferase